MKRVLLAMIFVVAFSAMGSAQAYTYYFPHVTTGAYSGGSWKTTIFISNSSAPGTTASGTITFTKSDGTPYNISFVDDVGRPVGGGNTISFTLGTAESRKFISVADQPLTTGYATVTANAAVLGTAMFTQFDGSGRMTGEAGVPAAIPLGKQGIFVDTTSGFMTGVAIANPNSATLEIHLELMNATGQMIASVVRSLGPFQHFALFVHELFPGTPAMIGRLQFYCTNPMVSVGLRFDPSFNLFTTLPPIAIAGLMPAFELQMSVPAFFRREQWLVGI